MCISLLGDGAFLVALAWQVYELSDARDGDVARRHRDDRADDRLPARRRASPAIASTAAGSCSRPTSCAPSRSALLAVLSLDGRARAVARRGARRLLRDRGGVLRARVRRDRAGAAPGRRSSRRPTRSTRSCGRSRCGSPGPALGGVLVGAFGAGHGVRARRRDRSWSRPPPLLAMRRGAAAAGRRGRLRASATCARAGASCAAARGCGRRSPARRSPTCCFMGPGRGAPAALVKQELGGSATDLGLVFAAGGLGSVGCAVRDRPARAAAARHHVHVRRLDAGDARRRRLRRGGRRLAAHARLASPSTRSRPPGRSCGRRRSSATCPATMLGRVSSLDWLISIGLLAALLRAHRPGERGDRRAGRRWSRPAWSAPCVTLSALFLPGMRAVEGREPLHEVEAAGPGRAPSHAAAALDTAPGAGGAGTAPVKEGEGGLAAATGGRRSSPVIERLHPPSPAQFEPPDRRAQRSPPEPSRSLPPWRAGTLGLVTAAALDWAPEFARPIVAATLAAVEADPGLLGLTVGGSAATGTMDEFSDVDFVLVCRDEDQPRLLRDAPAFAAALGPLLACLHRRARRRAAAAHRALRAAAAPRRPQVRGRARPRRPRGGRTGAVAARPGRSIAPRACRGGLAAARPAVDRGPVLDLDPLRGDEGRPRRGARVPRHAGRAAPRRARPADRRGARAPPGGVRRLERIAPDLVPALEATLGDATAAGCLRAMEATAALYRRLATDTPHPGLVRRTRRGDRRLLEYLAAIAARVRGALIAEPMGGCRRCAGHGALTAGGEAGGARGARSGAPRQARPRGHARRLRHTSSTSRTLAVR